MEDLPSNSILFRLDDNKDDKDEEIFNSVIFKKMVDDHRKLYKEKEKKKDVSIRGKLKNLMLCNKCKKNFKDLYFCPLCKKYACKKCYNRLYYFSKKDHVPCPYCNQMIKRYYLKPITFLKAIAEVAEPEEEDDIKLIAFNTNELINKCDRHKKNEIWAYCIDCNKKMCPVCYNCEQHSQHRVVNYKTYLDLNLFLGVSFKSIKEFVLKSEKIITDLQRLNSELDNQKSALLGFSLDLYDAINNIFQEGQEKISRLIDSLTSQITEYNNFKNNIKKYITKSIPIGFSDFENIEEIEKEIKERIGSLNIVIPKSEDVKKIEKDYYKQNIELMNIQETIDINNEILTNGLKTNFKNYNCEFIAELGEDQEEVNFYLNIDKKILDKININPYLIKIKIFNYKKEKILYLEKANKNDNENDNNISFFNSLPKKDINEIIKNGHIKIRIDYFNLI